MTHIMIVAKDTLGTINTHVISGLFKINKIQTTKMFTLKTISKSNTSFVYHIEVKVADETYFVEMRKHKLTSHKIYLCCTSRKCNAVLALQCHTYKNEFMTIAQVFSLRIAQKVKLYYSLHQGCNCKTCLYFLSEGG